MARAGTVRTLSPPASGSPSRWSRRRRAATVSERGERRSWGRVSQAGKQAAESGPRKAATSAARASASAVVAVVTTTSRPPAWAIPASRNARATSDTTTSGGGPSPPAARPASRSAKAGSSVQRSSRRSRRTRAVSLWEMRSEGSGQHRGAPQVQPGGVAACSKPTPAPDRRPGSGDGGSEGVAGLGGAADPGVALVEQVGDHEVPVAVDDGGRAGAAGAPDRLPGGADDHVLEAVGVEEVPVGGEVAAAADRGPVAVAGLGPGAPELE